MISPRRTSRSWPKATSSSSNNNSNSSSRRASRRHCPRRCAAMRPAAHAAGLNQKQLDILAPAWNGFAAKTRDAQTAQQAAGLAEQFNALKTEWGGAYENRLARAGDALEHLAAAAKVDLGAVE